MMKTSRIFLFILVVVLVSGCNKSETIELPPLGICSHPINPSFHDYQFASAGGSVEVTTEISSWISTWNSFSGPEDVITIEREDRTGVITLIQSDWFSISMQSRTKFIVTFQPNTTGQERKFELDLAAGDCFDRLTFTQSAD
jgi:hypothetical protein